MWKVLQHIVVKWYEMELVSQENAAVIAGLTRSEFQMKLSNFNTDEQRRLTAKTKEKA